MHRSFVRVMSMIAIMLAIGVAGCGDDDQSSGAANSAQNDTAQPPGARGAVEGEIGGGDFSGPTAKINETLVGIQEAFVNLDGAGYCSYLTAVGVLQVEQFGKALGLGTECTAIMDTLARNTRDTGIEQKPSKLVSVKFDGDVAVAQVRDGGRPKKPMTFVKDGDQWKMPDPGLMAAIKPPSEPMSFAERIAAARKAQDTLARRLQSDKGQ